MKRKILTLYRIFKAGVVNLSRNLSLAAAAVAVMVVTLTIVLFSLVASATFNHSVSQLTAKLDVSIYLRDGISQQQINSFVSRIKAQPNIKQVTYFTKTQDLAQAEAQNAGNATLLQALGETGNVIPAKILVVPTDPNKLEALKTFLDKSQNLALEDPQTPTSYSGDEKTAIDKIAHATSIMREAGIGAVVVFALISMLIIFNTLRMAIFNRRDEINIERLLGANTWYIRGPFVVEIMMYGILAALVSIGFIYLMFVGSANALKASSLGLLDISYADRFFKAHFWALLLLQLMVGILIGAVSSVIATRRYLKFKTK